MKTARQEKVRIAQSVGKQEMEIVGGRRNNVIRAS